MVAEPFRELGKLLLVFAGLLALLGALLTFGTKLPTWLGRLPGDLVIQRENFTFYFPVVTCLLLSVILSLLFWFFGRLRP